MSETDFSRNLKLLCSFEKSVSDVCRAININRQQFNKYLNGASRPSVNNLQRICAHFATQPFEMHLPHEDFSDRLRFRAVVPGQSRERLANIILKRAFPGNRRTLGRYLGYYLSHCHSFSWQGYILRALVCVYDRDGMVFTRTLERSRDPEDGAVFLSKYDGYVSMMGDRIFVVELESLARDAIVETILHPVGRSQLATLRGVTLGLSSKQRAPCVSRTVWKYLGQTVDYRAAVRAVGLLPVRSPLLDRKIIKILGDAPFPNKMLDDNWEPSEK